MYSRYDPNINLSMLTFAWQLNLTISVYVDVNIIFPPTGKAKYGSAIYGTNVYDPTVILSVLTADALTKWLMLHMVRRFLLSNQRGYKYSMPQSIYWLNAEIPMLETTAPEPVWYVRVRKIDASRNWTAFYDMAFFDVNAFPMDRTYALFDTDRFDMSDFGYEERQESEILIRFSDMLRSIFNMARFDDGLFDYPPNSLTSLDNIFANTHRANNISANFFDCALFDRAPYAGDSMQYPELYLLAPNTVAYMPVFDVANFDFDVFYTAVSFDEGLVSSIVENAKQTQQPYYLELGQMRGSERMHTMYDVHAAFQSNRQYRIQKILSDYNVPRIQVSMYHAFMMEYTYKKMAEQLVDKETVIQRYIRLGLSETVLRAIAAMTSR